MGHVEDAVNAAAHFVGPFLGKGSRPGEGDNDDLALLLEQALSHLQAINTAEKAAGPNAPYDGSLVGVVYGLLDLVTSLGILPYLSDGVAFSQRPQSVLVTALSIPPLHGQDTLSNVVQALRPMLEQEGTGVQPLLSQRVLPDVISALAELSFSPRTSDGTHATYTPLYEKTLSTTPTSRLLPVLTSFLQHDVPSWWKPRLSKELSLVPLRPHGVRHVIEFLSLSYLSKNSRVPQDASGPQAQIPLPLEAITQASRLITAAPSGTSQDEWITRLAPQLFALLDGTEGIELSRAAGQIIASGILNKKCTGAPKAVGWELFARPLQEAIVPKNTGVASASKSSERVLVSEQHLQRSLRRLATITSSYSHAGLLKRLVGPLLISLWGLINHASSRPSLDKEWTGLAHAILLRYLTIACEPQRIGVISSNLFWDEASLWTFAPGSEGGVEIRKLVHGGDDTTSMEGILSRIGVLNQRIDLLVSLLVEAKIEDHTVGAIFLETIKKWLARNQGVKPSLTQESDTDPIQALTNVKLAQALANKFADKLARSPQHIIELANQLLQNYMDGHRARLKKLANKSKPSRATLGSLVQASPSTSLAVSENENDDIASFALGIINTLVTSPDFKRSPETIELFKSMGPLLRYLAQSQELFPIPPHIANAATNVIAIIQPASTSTSAVDPQAEYRTTLKMALTDLTSPEPPNRGWALSALRKLIQNSNAFPVVDVPSITQAVLSVSVADSDSYVYSAAMPVLVDLAVRAPNPTVRIIVDTFTDVDERSLRLKKEKEIEQALDFRLRVGEIINNIILEDQFWHSSATAPAKFSSLKLVVEATLSLASRRGQRKKTLAKRNQLLDLEIKQQEEGEAAWSGPIPNLLDPDADNPIEQAERDALLRMLQGWENTGIEEDVRIRASALSILGSVMEKRLEFLSQVIVDAGLQMVLLVLTMETGEAKGLLRRAAVLVVMGLLKGMDALLEDGRESAVGLGVKQMEEVERVMGWVRSEDGDSLVGDHAGSVLEGLETWRMKKLYKVREGGLGLGHNLGLDGNLRGLDVRPLQDSGATENRGRIVEEVD
ncbi:hypothetical protein K458DRAFT_426388 [Lentithecium fluviatile CBS 122367]|uniref:Uncharacterized protein n=1 Tax=Lentithecium fluviatile CBS 122367 TaxID=1168545 RepID=A0A6G1JKA3_9PLEO|nr:hypothetical protein K458DRAFT_426388 [Lentithecium fluviatile CBS 122367]